MRDHRLEETAFPSDSHRSIGPDGSKWPYSPGMTLRDYFAGQALAGIMAQSHAGPADWTKMGFGWGEDCLNSLNKNETFVAHTISGFAYKIADAMLAERSK